MLVVSAAMSTGGNALTSLGGNSWANTLEATSLDMTTSGDAGGACSAGLFDANRSGLATDNIHCAARQSLRTLFSGLPSAASCTEFKRLSMRFPRMRVKSCSNLALFLCFHVHQTWICIGFSSFSVNSETASVSVSPRLTMRQTSFANCRSIFLRFLGGVFGAISAVMGQTIPKNPVKVNYERLRGILAADCNHLARLSFVFCGRFCNCKVNLQHIVASLLHTTTHCVTINCLLFLGGWHGNIAKHIVCHHAENGQNKSLF